MFLIKCWEKTLKRFWSMERDAKDKGNKHLSTRVSCSITSPLPVDKSVVRNMNTPCGWSKAGLGLRPHVCVRVTHGAVLELLRSTTHVLGQRRAVGCGRHGGFWSRCKERCGRMRSCPLQSGNTEQHKMYTQEQIHQNDCRKILSNYSHYVWKGNQTLCHQQFYFCVLFFLQT